MAGNPSKVSCSACEKELSCEKGVNDLKKHDKNVMHTGNVERKKGDAKNGVKVQTIQRHPHSVTRVGVSPCGPMAEGHGDSAPQGALKVALSGTLDRAGVLVGGSVAWFRFTRNCTWAEGESNSALSLRYPTTKSYLPSRRAFCPLGDAALSFTTVL